MVVLLRGKLSFTRRLRRECPRTILVASDGDFVCSNLFPHRYNALAETVVICAMDSLSRNDFCSAETTAARCRGDRSRSLPELDNFPVSKTRFPPSLGGRVLPVGVRTLIPELGICGNGEHPLRFRMSDRSRRYSPL